MMTCECSVEGQDALVRTALAGAINDLAGILGAMSIVRNGGYEAVLRWLLLIRLEETRRLIGFSESGGRADIVMCCKTCNGARAIAVELKTNFVVQKDEIRRRILGWRNRKNRLKKGALHQLHALHDKHACSSYYLGYLIIELEAPKGDELARPHEFGGGPKYKFFQTSEVSMKALKEVTDVLEQFSDSRLEASSVPLMPSGQAKARLHAYLARVQFCENTSPATIPYDGSLSNHGVVLNWVPGLLIDK